MAEKTSIDTSQANYVLGILSIVFGVLSPIAGIVIGIIGLVQSKKQTNPLAKRAKKLSTIGIIIGIIVLIISIVVAVFASQTMQGLTNFPIA